MRLLLVGDEFRNRRLLAGPLAALDWDITTATTRSALERALRQTGVDYRVVLLDGEAGVLGLEEVISTLHSLAARLPLIVLAESEARGRWAARERGVAARCAPAAIREQLQSLGLAGPPPAAAPEDDTLNVQSENPAMQRHLEIAWRAAPTPATVLLLGENGTGKSLLARAIHDRSPRRAGPFITVNAPCLQAHLAESELFGHAKGSFTGAIGDAIGKVEAAEGGTLFLDEIGELPPSLQPKLLRLLQDRCYERVGEAKTRSADIRVLAATNRLLKKDVAEGRFREDLYYRLNVIAVETLPLRRRPEDILPAAERFLQSFSSVLGKSFLGFAPMAQAALQTYRWPGNLRELRNAVERAAILSESSLLEASDFPDLAARQPEESLLKVGDLVSIEQLAAEHMRQVMARVANYKEAARILGIDKSTLYRWRKRSTLSLTPFPLTEAAECTG